MGGYGAGRAWLNLTLALVICAAPLRAEVTIAALGDSLTAGYGLRQEEGLVPQLQAWLDAQGVDADVLNAGVSGDTTAGGLSRTDWTLTPEVDGVIVALGGNDVLRGLPADAARANLGAILEKAAARDLPVLLVGISVPGNFGPDYQAEFQTIYPELAEEYGALLHPDLLGVLARMPDRAEARARYILPDGLHPNAAGVALVAEDIGPSVLKLIERAK